MTSGNVSTDKMHNDAWLDALRSDPSPLFKAQLRERLHATGSRRPRLAAIGPAARWSPRLRSSRWPS